MELSGEAKRRFRLQDYSPKPSIKGVEVVELHRHTDDGGSFTELGRFTAGVSAAFGGFVLAQVNYSELEPGAIKAFHLHRRQTDVWFVPPGDKILLAPSRPSTSTGGRPTSGSSRPGTRSSWYSWTCGPARLRKGPGCASSSATGTRGWC